MVKAWYMNDDSSDHRLEHHKEPPELVSLKELYLKTGVEHFALDVTTYQTDGILDQIKKERGYTYEDELVCVKGGKDLEEVTKKFYKEHLHSEEETRFIYEGSGYFDVRDDRDRWLRVGVRAGDLLVLPSGIYHRFTLDTNEHVKVKRFFVGQPEWCGHNRPSDDMACRRQYLSNQQRGFATTQNTM